MVRFEIVRALGSLVADVLLRCEGSDCALQIIDRGNREGEHVYVISLS